MPVPVPHRVKPVAHPVTKPLDCDDVHLNPFDNVTRTLPHSPTGPPPAYGTREQWISSLPSWRRKKIRRIWEEEDMRNSEHYYTRVVFPDSTIASDSPTIKGTQAEACLPPLHSLFPSYKPLTQHATDSDVDVNCVMSTENSPLGSDHLDHLSQLSASSPFSCNDEDVVLTHSNVENLSSGAGLLPDLQVDQGTFSLTCGDGSPDAINCREKGSSPLQPVTPFADYVDRAVASVHQLSDDGVVQSNDDFSRARLFEACNGHLTYPDVAEHVQEPMLARAQEVLTPNVATGYKKIAEPFAEWVASYIWKVCTTGLSLPSCYARPLQHSVPSYPVAPPSHLITSVRSLLFSTLLQPSAIFLAIWYITRLPVYFSAAPLDPQFVKEERFRAALLGDSSSSYNQEVLQPGAPFRLIVLGCMLANKWLDDHTFSNKTWHSISNVPIQVLNHLESLSLDIFAYDLSIPSVDWHHWLTHVMTYHMSLISSTHPQPISRPSCNPHSIIRKVIEDTLQAPVACDSASSPAPFFIGLEERKRHKMEREHAFTTEVLEIDLDEDGPLRAEYLPKRRICSQTTRPLSQTGHADVDVWGGHHARGMETALPPPAKWSPAGDEPFYPERNRSSGHYVAVQPQILHDIHPYPAPYLPYVDPRYPLWNSVGTHISVNLGAVNHFNYSSTDGNNLAPYSSYSYPFQFIPSRFRSHSLDYESMRARNHLRTSSQVSAYRYGDSFMKTNQLHHCQPLWLQYPYPCPAFTPVQYPSTEIRT